MENCLFCKIVRKEIPADVVFENDDVLVFPDIHPQAPVHLLIIPKSHIEEFVKAEDSGIFQKLFHVARDLVKQYELQEKRYKIMINGGGLQDINHLHIHLLGKVA